MLDILKPTLKDFEEINIIAREVQEQHIDYRPDIFKTTDYPIPYKQFNELIFKNKIFIVKNAEVIIAYIIIEIQEKKSPICFERKILHIEILVVKKDFIGKGIGSQLIDYVTNLAKEKNCTDIELTVSPENASAIKFYEKLGMKVKNIKYQKSIRD